MRDKILFTCLPPGKKMINSVQRVNSTVFNLQEQLDTLPYFPLIYE
jgi:hypothetical protein